MKNYFVMFTGMGRKTFTQCEWFEARNDYSAMSKAGKLAREERTGVRYVAECFEEDEEDRVIFKR